VVRSDLYLKAHATLYHTPHTMAKLAALASLSLPHLLDEPVLVVFLAYGGDFRTDRIFHCTGLRPRACNVSTRSFAKRGHHAFTPLTEHTSLSVERVDYDVAIGRATLR